MGTDPEQDSEKQISVMGNRLDLSQVIFLLLVMIHGSAVLATFREYGVNPDEAAHIDYGHSVFLWYQSLFQQRGVFSRINIWLYGGLYDTLVHLVTRISPLGLHDTRHLCNATVGIVGIWGAYKLGGLYGKRWFGLLAALFLLLTPRYYGHSFINHKDIPFAAAYLWSVYLIAKAITRLPQLSIRMLLSLGLSIGICLGVRIGGVILLGYLGLFFALRYVQILYLQGFTRKAWFNAGKTYLRQVVPISTIAYTIMLLFWPWAQLDPVFRPLQALRKFSSFSYDIRAYFEGYFIRSTEIPWYYAPKWILLTLPDFLVLSLAAGILYCIRNWRRLKPGNLHSLNLILLAFSALFPILIVIATNTPLCNGIRHLIFSTATLTTLGAVLAAKIILKARRPKVFALALASALCVGLLDMLSLHPNEYVYFNRLFAGGTANASTKYETDYYQHSYTQGIHWINKDYVPKSRGKVKVAGISPNQWYLVNQDKFEYVVNPWNADLYIVNTHFETHRNIPGEVVHRISADGAELLYIIRPDSSHADGALFLDSSSPYRYYHLGSIMQSAGRYEEALIHYQKGIQLDPGDANFHNAMGDLHFILGDYSPALRSYTRAAHLKPDIAVYQANLAKTFQHMGKYPEALAHYNAAIDRSPEYRFALYNHGRLLFALGRMAEAESAYRDLIRKFPSYAKAYLDLGILKENQGRLVEASEMYISAIQHDSWDPESYRGLGTSLFSMGKIQEAQAALTEGLEKFPEAPVLHFNLARCLYTLGRTTEALFHLSATQAVDPDYPNLDYNTGMAQFRMQNWTQSILSMKRSLTRSPDQSHGWYTLARAYRAITKLDSSHEAIWKAIELDGTNKDYWVEFTGLGAHYQQSGHGDNAKAIYVKVIAASPSVFEAHFNLGILHYGEGAYESARSRFSDAVALSPDDHQAHLALAQCNQRLGLTQEAILEYRHVLRLQPNHAVAIRELHDIKPDTQMGSP